MTYQVRHARWGIYQGSCMGLGFWLNPEEPWEEQQPEQGLLRLTTLDEAEECIRWLENCPANQPDGESAGRYTGQLRAEPFDERLHERLLAFGEQLFAMYRQKRRNA